MAYLAPRFNSLNHHPRWSNEWTTVQIRLTTWDADNQITSEDVRTAHMVDQARKEFLATQLPLNGSSRTNTISGLDQ
jgi:pterin-4a-carbinolamine dehydratase